MAERPPPQTTTSGCYFSMDHIPQVAHKHSVSADTVSSSVSTSRFSSTSTASSVSTGFSMISDSTPTTPLVNISQIAATTTTVKRIQTYQKPQLDQNGQPIDVLARTYDKPHEELDVEEALARAPLPGTYRYSAQRAVAEKAMTPEERRADMERVKREWRGDSLGIKKK